MKALRWTALLAAALGLTSKLSGMSSPALVGALDLLVPEARADNIVYAYDALGRLIQASNLDGGQAVMYEYDSVGNIASQQTVSLATLAISGFSGNQGAAGTQLIIDGTGFSTTPGDNVVSFNGVAATVIAASQTQLIVVVPPGATSGEVSVHTGAATVNSPAPFNVTAGVSVPAITGFSPTLAVAGATLTIAGTGFDPSVVNDKIQIGNGPWGASTSATATNLIGRLPAKLWDGKVRVATPHGTAVSTSDFFTPPSGYTVATIGSTGRLVAGTPATLTLPLAGQSSLQIFDGSAGDLLSIGVTATNLASATLKVFTPDGTQLTSGAITASGQGLQLPQLPRSGTYALIIDPAQNTGSLTLKLAAPVTGSLTPGGASLTLPLTTFGQRGIVTFNGTAAQYLTLGITNNSIASATVVIAKPDGGTLVSATVTGTSGVQLPQLPATGSYTIRIDPGSNSGSLTLALVTPINTTATVGGPAVPLNLTPAGERAFITFNGTAGQYLTLVLPFFSGTLTVTTPSGTTLSTTTATSITRVQLPVLPTTGTYTILADPGASAENTSLSILPAVLGSDATNDSDLSLSNPAARGVITFTGNPGDYIALTLQEGVQQSSSISNIKITLVAPDGSVLNGTDISGPPRQGPIWTATCPGICYGNSIVNLGPLPSYAAGTTFTAVIEQTAGNGGRLHYVISKPPVSPAGPLVVNAPAMQVYLAVAGMGTRIPVNLVAGRGYSLTISETSRNSPQIVGLLLDAQGRGVQGAGMTATCAPGCPLGALNQYSGSESDGIGVGTTGTYTLLLQQVTQTSGANAYGPLAGDIFVQIQQIAP
jgi:YD repeat-containing protein